MVVGLGIDIVETDRIARIWRRFGEQFAQKILTPTERARLTSSPVQALAARFAAKEAAVKALGTGFAQGITCQCLEIHSRANGKPELIFHGPAHTQAARLGVTQAHISLTHGRDSAVAVVVLEA